MKFDGQEFKQPNIRTLIIRRQDASLTLTFKPSDMEKFESIYPEPKPRKMRKKGSNEWLPNRKDPKFLEAMEKRKSAQMDYMIISALEPSNIEWDNVDINDPNTWENWRKDFLESGFTNFEINRIFMTAMTANSLNDEDITKAEEDFLAMEQEVEIPEPTQMEEPASI